MYKERYRFYKWESSEQFFILRIFHAIDRLLDIYFQLIYIWYKTHLLSYAVSLK